MKKNKGFTLIELLAVIIILAVIALIATPIVLNVVDNAKESARQASVSGYADTGKLAVTEYQFGHEGQTPKIDQAFIDTIKPQGDKVVCGQDGETPGVYYSNQYGMVLHGCKVGNDDKLYYFASGKTYTKDENNKLPDEYTNILNSIKGPQISNVVYFNPVTNQVCSDYVEANSSTGVKSGCMKWYIYKIDGDNVGLLLDHNTTANVSWISKEDYISAGGTEAEYGSNGNNTKGPITLLKQLQTDTTNWTASEIDIITAIDIAKVTGNTEWTTGSSYFYFDTNTSTQSETCKYGDTSGCKYRWLYDRTNEGCTRFGCLNNSDATTDGYWTKDATSSSIHAWIVHYGGGYLYKYDVIGADPFGVRPVITISKSLIK